MNPSTRRALQTGALAGVIAGVVLSLYIATLDLSQGNDVWADAKLAGYPFLGSQALLPGFDFFAVAIGVLSHLGVSLAWGLAFGLLAYGRSAAATIASGLTWGIVAWLMMFHAVMPAIGLTPLADAVPVTSAVIEHVIFGLTLALAMLPMQPAAPAVLQPHIDTRPPVARARAS